MCVADNTALSASGGSGITKSYASSRDISLVSYDFSTHMSKGKHGVKSLRCGYDGF